MSDETAPGGHAHQGSEQTEATGSTEQETEAAIQRRLATAKEELAFADMYRYQVTNQTVDRAVDEILKILGD